MKLLLPLSWFVVACGSTAPTPLELPSNTTAPTGWSPTLSVDAKRFPGRLGVVPSPGEPTEAVPWAPTSDATALLIDTPDVTHGTALLAVPARGDAEPVQAEAATKLVYGCDGGTLDVVPLRGAVPLSPGPVLLLPPTLPDGWRPTGVEVRETEATAGRRAWTAGPLRVSLSRVDDTHATLEIRAGDRLLHTGVEETYTMEGAEPRTIDLSPRQFQPGVAMPSAVFLLAADGPAVVVLATQGFEGWTLSTLLVGADGAEPVDTLGVYLYSCAF